MDLRAAAYKYLDVRSESGDELDVLCPVHEDSNPSCRVNVKKGVYYCHTCHAAGKLEFVLKEMAGGYLTLSNEVDLLDMQGIELDPEPRFHSERWLDQFDDDGDYWTQERGLKMATVRRYRLGHDHALDQPTYPIRDERGRVLGVVRRRLEHWARPRYLYPDGVKVHEHLFGLHEATQDHGTSSVVYLTEGAIDAMALAEVGVVAMGMYGSKLGDAQVELLRRFGATVVVLAFDDDEAGDQAAWGWSTSPKRGQGKFIPGAVHKLKGFVVETVDWSLLRGPERPRGKARQLDPASLSRRKRRELVEAPLSLVD